MDNSKQAYSIITPYMDTRKFLLEQELTQNLLFVDKAIIMETTCSSQNEIERRKVYTSIAIHAVEETRKKITLLLLNEKLK